MKKQIRNMFMSLLIISIILLNGSQITYAKDDIKDYEKYWTGTFLNEGEKETADDGKVSRLEFAVLLSRLFGLTDTSGKLKFEDVKQEEWYAKDIDKVVTSGFMNYGGGYFYPDKFITREEVAYAIVRAYQINIETDKVFADEEVIGSWAKEAAISLVEMGCMDVDEKGAFRPRDEITKKELRHIIEQLTPRVIDQTGTYLDNVDGNLIINRGGVLLKNVTIFGNAYLSTDIGQGDIRFENVTIKGDIILQKNMSMQENVSTHNKEIIIKTTALSKLTKEDIQKAQSVIEKVVTTEIEDKIVGIGIITKQPVTSCNAAYNGKSIQGEEAILENDQDLGDDEKLYEIYFNLPAVVEKTSYNSFPIQMSLVIDGVTYQFALKTDFKN